jgi:glutamine synthetase
MDQLEQGVPKSTKQGGFMEVGVSILPKLPRDPGDRNRTSPFAFTGNKFEFRAVGSNQSIAFPLVVLNCIMADSLDYIATQLETETGGDKKKLNEAVQKVLQGIAQEHGAVIFGGNNYSEEWHAEAEKRGLPNLKNTLEALPVLLDPENVEVLSKYKVLSEREIHSRYDILLEKYSRDINTEGMLALEIAKTKILPAALTYQAQLASLAMDLKNLGKTPGTATLDEVMEQTAALERGIADLKHVLDDEEKEDLLEHARHYRDLVVPHMGKVREAVDALEGLLPDDLWPLPTYQEMLFIK